jgi:iron complex outermembrane receptor protein
MKGSMGDWHYDSALVVNHTWLDSDNFGLLSYPQLIADVRNGTYNFVDPSNNSPAVRAALAPDLSVTATSDMDSIDLRADRPLFDLPGGPLGFAVGGEFRHEAQHSPELNPNRQYQDYIVARTIGSRNVAALYAELDASVWQALELDLSARYDHYTDVGGTFNPKLGFKWTPLDAFALRGTYARGFRAPSFAENGSSANESFISYTPPTDWAATHNNDGYTAPYLFDVASSANPRIRPEHSSSVTFGALVQPASWLNASLDYYAIKKTGVIVPSDPNVALADYFAGQPLPAGYSIVADAPDPLYPTALPRPIVVSAPYLNANSLRTDGLDLDLRAQVDLGASVQLISDLTATRIFSWSMRFPDGTTQQYVGTQGPYILSSGAGTPRDRANWANTVIRGPLEATATIHYVSGLFMSAPDIVPGCFSINFATGANFPPNCRMASFTEVDLTGTWHYDEHIDFSAALLNAFDRKPPLDPINYAGLNYNPTYAQAGIVGRFFKLGVRIRF